MALNRDFMKRISIYLLLFAVLVELNPLPIKADPAKSLISALMNDHRVTVVSVLCLYFAGIGLYDRSAAQSLVSRFNNMGKFDAKSEVERQISLANAEKADKSAKIYEYLGHTALLGSVYFAYKTITAKS